MWKIDFLKKELSKYTFYINNRQYVWYVLHGVHCSIRVTVSRICENAYMIHKAAGSFIADILVHDVIAVNL